MTGREKIKELTSEWYGLAIFSSLVNLVLGIFGAGFFAFLTVPFIVAGAVLSLLLTWAIGRLLIKKSRVMWIALLVLSPVFAVLGSYGVWHAFTGEWSVSSLLNALVVACAVWLHVRSFRTLLDKDVRAYFR